MLSIALALLLTPTADAAKAPKETVVTVRAVDAEGKPMAAAVVMVGGETSRHRVNAADGTWRASYPAGWQMQFQISAAGYKPVKWSGPITDAPIEAVLVPIPAESISDPATAAAVAAWMALEQAQFAPGASRTEDDMMKAWDAQYHAAYAATVWVHGDPKNETARMICMGASDAPLLCVPPDQAPPATP